MYLSDCACISKHNVSDNYQFCTDNNTLFPSCLPINYGISCSAHDMIHNPKCTSNETNDIPEFCYEEWCYVNYESCLTSTASFQKSVMFQTSGLFYSYSVCNSTSAAWDSQMTIDSLKGKKIIATVPEYLYPLYFKRNSKGEVIEDDSVYWNNSIPWEGVMMEYFEAVLDGSSIGSIQYTHRSVGSSEKHPESVYTASVSDVSSALSDVAVGDFWATSQRLKMTPFTVPFQMGKIYLVLPMTTSSSKISESVVKLAKPFTAGTWSLIFVIVILTSFVGLWLTTEKAHFGMYHDIFRSDKYQRSNIWGKMKIVILLLQDYIIMNFGHFFGGAVQIDLTLSYPFKVLMIGFSFLVMITYSAYVANLAAFLTTEAQNTPIKSMKDVIVRGTLVCAPPALEKDLNGYWPEVMFVYNYDHPDHIIGQFEFFENNQCEALTISEWDIKSSSKYEIAICEKGLSMTDIVVMDEMLSFPATAEVAPGLSHLIAEKKLSGLHFIDFIDPYTIKSCSLPATEEDNDMKQLEPVDMLFPVIVFFICLVYAVVLRLINNWKKRNRSQFEKNIEHPNPDDLAKYGDNFLGNQKPRVSSVPTVNKTMEMPTSQQISIPLPDKITSKNDRAQMEDVSEICMFKDSEMVPPANNGLLRSSENNEHDAEVVDNLGELIKLALMIKEKVELNPKKKDI